MTLSSNVKCQMSNVFGFLVSCCLLLAACSGWFFTLMVDLPMLIILGYATSFFIYRVLTRRWKWIGVFAPLLLPINILALWLGGVLPYLDLLTPEAVYFGLVPKEWLGASGNDFMWNGFLGARVVPLELQPTYQHFWFTAYAIFIWLTMPLALGYASLIGYRDATVPASWHRIFWSQLLKMIVVAYIVWILTLSITRFLVWISS